MKTKALAIVVLMSVFVLAGFSAGYASEGGRFYSVTITNITRGQIISPPIVFTHAKPFNLFEVGEPASDALARLAEDGITADLEAVLLGSSSVYAVGTAPGPILPGESVTVEIKARGPYRFLSAAGMLVSTNDAFAGAHGLLLPRGFGSATYYAAAYDAGSEANSESCEVIPGPPCGQPGVRDTDGAEGYVHVHAGIHGIGDLAPEEADWRNPVVKIHIQALFGK